MLSFQPPSPEAEVEPATAPFKMPPSGRLWLVSKPGEGSTFSFSMPRADVVSLVGSENGGRSTARATAHRSRGSA